MKQNPLVIVERSSISVLPLFGTTEAKSVIYKRKKMKAVINYSLNEKHKAIALAEALNKQGIQVFLVIDRTSKQITVWTQTERIKRKQKTKKERLSLRERYNLVFTGKARKINQHRIVKCCKQNQNK